MRRGLALGVLLTLGALSFVVSANQQGGAQQPKVVQVEKLKDNLFVLKGGGGNTAVFVRATDVVVVDAKLPGWGQPLLDKIKELTTKPVSTIINTHTHFDHVSGNVEFPATVEVVTQENTKANMMKMAPVTGLNQQPQPNIFTVNNGRGLPKKTFKDKMTLGSGNDRIDLYYFGRGHTNGDAWVLFPSLRILHAGDMFPGKNMPIMDANNGGSGVAYTDTLSKAAKTVTAVDTIITGHSTQMTLADLKEYAEFMRDFRDSVQEAKKAGKLAEKVANGWQVPAKYQGYGKPNPVQLKTWVQVTMDELK